MSMKGWLFIMNINSENFSSETYPGNGYIIIDIERTPRIIKTLKLEKEKNPIVTQMIKLESSSIYMLIFEARRTMKLPKETRIYVDKYEVLDVKYITMEHKLYAPISFYNSYL